MQTALQRTHLVLLGCSVLVAGTAVIVLAAEYMMLCMKTRRTACNSMLQELEGLPAGRLSLALVLCESPPARRHCRLWHLAPLACRNFASHLIAALAADTRLFSLLQPC
jgi:hypothetical protein